MTEETLKEAVKLFTSIDEQKRRLKDLEKLNERGGVLQSIDSDISVTIMDHKTGSRFIIKSPEIEMTDLCELVYESCLLIKRQIVVSEKKFNEL